MEDFTAASERIVAGLEKRNRVLSPAERKIVAYHEMGHALVGLALPGSDRVHKVSIIPRGLGALGYTIRRPTEDRFLVTREELENKMAVLLGGRAAEQLVFGAVSTGAADDLQKATEIARNMVARFGMAKELGPVTYEGDSGEGVPLPPGMGPSSYRYSEVTAQRIDGLVQRVVESALERAISILRERRDALEKGATRLLEHETLGEDELLALAQVRTAPRRRERSEAAEG
jgi:cell division protease FtsH